MRRVMCAIAAVIVMSSSGLTAQYPLRREIRVDNCVVAAGRSYAAEPDVLVQQLAQDEAMAAAATLLLTVPNQLGVDYNAHAIESILKYVAPELGWR